MLRGMKQLFGYAIEARDGPLGKVEDFYFDDYVWRVRYLVAKTGGWLIWKDVLISPAALDTPRPDDRCFPVKLTQDQVRNSPEVDTDLPVSRQMEESMGLHFGWPAYWLIEAFPTAAAPELAAAPVAVGGVPSGDPHLRSVREITGYDVWAADGDSAFGSVTDFILEDEDWTVRYVVVRSAGEKRAEELVLNPWWAREIDWTQQAMHFDLSTAQLRESPPYHPASALDRDYEERLHAYYDRPVYWNRGR